MAIQKSKRRRRIRYQPLNGVRTFRKTTMRARAKRVESKYATEAIVRAKGAKPLDDFERFKIILKELKEIWDEEKLLSFIKSKKWTGGYSNIKERMMKFIRQLLQSKHIALIHINEELEYGVIALRDFKFLERIPITGHLRNGKHRKINPESCHDHPSAKVQYVRSVTDSGESFTTKVDSAYLRMRREQATLDGPVYFVNHECSCTCASGFEPGVHGKNTVYLSANKLKIKAGQPISIYYGKTFFIYRKPPLKCICGHCNGVPPV